MRPRRSQADARECLLVILIALYVKKYLKFLQPVFHIFPICPRLAGTSRLRGTRGSWVVHLSSTDSKALSL